MPVHEETGDGWPPKKCKEMLALSLADKVAQLLIEVDGGAD